jgi:regulator of protease activity HflC (stomatin/prohibitin superfamily)
MNGAEENLSRPGPVAPLGPVAQSVRIGFIALRLALLALGASWAVGNIRQVPPDRRVVVMRFGHVARVQNAGLVLAWPPPLEQITTLPSPDRQMSLALREQGADSSSETDFTIHQQDDAVSLRPQKDTMNAGYLLTGDGSVVQFDATLFYSITAPAAYVLAQDHVEPALGRLYRASAVALAAARGLDDFLVARPERHPGGGDDPAARRQRLAADMTAAINARLADLARHGSDLGVVVRRVDVVALLPPVAKSAFDSVLTVAQTAAQREAAARTEAATIRQQADRDRDRARTVAEAAAAERVHGADAVSATFRALAQGTDTPAHRRAVLAELYREKIGPILTQAGQVTTVDAASGQPLVLLGAHQGAPGAAGPAGAP